MWKELLIKIFIQNSEKNSKKQKKSKFEDFFTFF